MSKAFDTLVDESLEVERELRELTPGTPSLRCFIALCLERAGADYSDVEQIKERLADPAFGLKSGTAVFIRDLSKYIASGRIKEPPEKKRVGGMHFNQKDQAVFELGGQPERLFLLWVIAAEIAYQQEPGVFGHVENLMAHKARIAELEQKREKLFKSFPSMWKHEDLFIGKITGDGAALISFRLAPNMVPVFPQDSAAERLVDYLLEQGAEKRAKAA